jgi:hypothetical protein
VIVAHEGVEREGVAGECREHGAHPIALVHAERFAPAPAFDLVVTGAADIVIVVGVEREQHADAAVRFGVQHEEIPVHLGPDVDAYAVTATQVATFAQPYADPLLSLLDLCGSHGVGGRERQRCEQ